MSASMFVPEFARSFEFNNVRDFFHAITDCEGEYRVSGISPDSIFDLINSFFSQKRDVYELADLGYDMHGKPGIIKIQIRKIPNGRIDTEVSWRPLNI